jgi:hypothetical protein
MYVYIYMCPFTVPMEIIALANTMILLALVGLMWDGQQIQRGVLHKQLHGILGIKVTPSGNI